jgi:hypothetical protein
VLRFGTRPGGNGWVDGAAGVYRHADFITLRVQVRDDDSVYVAVSGAAPKTAAWVCNVAGIGRAMPGGGIAVASVDNPPKPLLTLSPTARGFSVPDTPLNRATSVGDCGMNGSFVWTYDRAAH